MVKNHLESNINWLKYFDSIRSQCPWSWRAWQQGLIDIVVWDNTIKPLAHYEARLYIVAEQSVEALAYELDYGPDEWLFSYPGYGPYATPVPVLIQQNRQRLELLRQQLKE